MGSTGRPRFAKEARRTDGRGELLLRTGGSERSKNTKRRARERGPRTRKIGKEGRETGEKEVEEIRLRKKKRMQKRHPYRVKGRQGKSRTADKASAWGSYGGALAGSRTLNQPISVGCFRRQGPIAEPQQ